MATGRVTEFDRDGGWGQVTDSVSGSTHPFHCTAIADGTRLIEVDTSVTFQLVAGRMGRWEARGLEEATGSAGA